MDKLGDRNFLPLKDFYQSQKKYSQSFNIPFYEDQVLINKSLFLLKDNIIFIYDLFDLQMENTFYFKSKDKIVALT